MFNEVTTIPLISVRNLCAKLGANPPPGREDVLLHGMATLDRATERDASFVQKEKYVERAEKSKAAIIFTSRDTTLNHPGAVQVDYVMEAVVEILNCFHPEPSPAARVAPTAVVSESATLGDNVYIGPHVVIGENVKIGTGTRLDAHCFVGDGAEVGINCRFFPRVTILDRVRIGDRVHIHSGTVIGADGFRYEMIRGRLAKIPQVGTVVIEDDVEIGANTAIDRAFLEETVIGARTKIDNLVQIAHNVHVGPDCVIVSQVGIAGSVKIGRGVMIAGKAAIKDHLKIGNGARIGGLAAVQNDLPDGAEVLGTPAVPVRTYAQFIRFFKEFPKYRKGLNSLKDRDGE